MVLIVLLVAVVVVANGWKRKERKTVSFGFSPAREPATVAAQYHCPPPERPPAPSTYAAPPVLRAFLERAHHQN